MLTKEGHAPASVSEVIGCLAFVSVFAALRGV